MDKIPTKIKETVKRYIAALEKHNIPLCQVVLFGSYATGKYNRWSDIDIALVSEVFEGIRMNDRNMIRRITLEISSDLEPLPYRPEDFTPDDPFVREILETGVRIV